jgi:LuxR family maltose regulon positive regulatory protein
MQSFLLDCAILERMSGPLCDAVRGLAAQTPSPSQHYLQKLEQANLFIFPLDEQREWYRLHRLFADLLQARLQAEDAERIPVLHRRASEWFAAHDFIDEAVQHAFEAGDHQFAAGRVEQYAQEILLRSETTTFLSWVDRLDHAQLKQRPKLGFYRAWALLYQGAPLSVVEDQISMSRAGPGPPGSSRSLEAIILLSQGQPEKALQYAEQALQRLPASEIFLRDNARLCAAICRLSLGDGDAGLALMDQATQKALHAGNRATSVTILCELAELRLRQMQLHAAEALYQRALALGTRHDGSHLPVAGQPLMGLGNLALERYELQEAQRLLLDGIQLAQKWSLISTLDGHLSLAKLYAALDDNNRLAETLAALDDLCRQFDASEFDDIIVELLKASINVRRENLAEARRWVLQRGLVGAPAQKPSYYEPGTIAAKFYKYELPVLARWHIAAARYEQAQAVLQELDILAQEAGRPYLLLESHLLQARIYHLLGDNQSSLESMKQALAIAAPQQSCRIFLMEGPETIELLKALKVAGDDPPLTDFVELLLGKIKPPAGTMASPRLNGGETLSPRELEVLQHLPSSLSVAELADELCISVNTVRTHLKNIYAKLGVHSRHEAVVLATQRDLIKDH